MLVRICTSTIPTIKDDLTWFVMNNPRASVEAESEKVRTWAGKSNHSHLKMATFDEHGRVTVQCPLCKDKAEDGQGHWTVCDAMEEEWKTRWTTGVATCILRNTAVEPKEVWMIARRMYARLRGPASKPWTNICGLWRKESMMEDLTNKPIECLETKLRTAMIECAARVWSMRYRIMSEGDEQE
jgi:hypothetical protein